jgi:hypothetical protein
LNKVLQHSNEFHMESGEQDAFRQLAEYKGVLPSGLFVAPSSDYSAARLVHRHYLTKERGAYDFKVQLIRSWYKNHGFVPRESEPTRKRFQIALCFPETYRDTVEKVAHELTPLFDDYEILYDRWQGPELADHNRDTYLPEQYIAQSRIVVLFLCEDHDVAQFCGLGWPVIDDIRHKHGAVMLWQPTKAFRWAGPPGEVIDGKKPPEIAAGIKRYYGAHVVSRG